MKYYYAWTDGHATTGTPNQTTGRHSCYGEITAFTTKESRDAFCDQFDHRYNTYPEPISKSRLRSKCLGSSVRDFENDLHWIEMNAREDL